MPEIVPLGHRRGDEQTNEIAARRLFIQLATLELEVFHIRWLV